MDQASSLAYKLADTLDIGSKRESRWWSGGMADYALDPLELTKETVHTQLYQLFKVFTDDGAFEAHRHRGSL